MDNIEIYYTKYINSIDTPLYLVNQMTNKIPRDVWKNKNIKILDFACGAGIFGHKIFNVLNQSLADEIPDVNERKNHIINNMLYFNDIDVNKINIIKETFNTKNVLLGDLLELEINMKFDVIIGNPPFQKTKTVKSNGNAIWFKFVDKLIKILNVGGYMSLIHPNGWRKCSSDGCKYTFLYEKLTKDMQMLYLEIHNSYDARNIFNNSIRYDWYVVHNKKKYKYTIINDENRVLNSIDLAQWKFIPNHSYKLVSEILKCPGDKINILYDRSSYCTTAKNISTIKTDKFIYPVINSITKNCIKLLYSSVNTLGMYGVKKVIIPETNIFNSIYDNDGKYALSESCSAILVKSDNEGMRILSAIKTRIFKIFVSSVKYSNYRFDYRIFYYLNDGIWEFFLHCNNVY